LKRAPTQEAAAADIRRERKPKLCLRGFCIRAIHIREHYVDRSLVVAHGVGALAQPGGYSKISITAGGDDVENLLQRRFPSGSGRQSVRTPSRTGMPDVWYRGCRAMFSAPDDSTNW
jgi:hypothetical protein